jgi:hypothetical protein
MIAREQKKFSQPEIIPAKPFKEELDLDKIVTADLESLILPDGSNKVFMAAWYNGKDHRVYNITQYELSTDAMLADFWLELINRNQGSILYFHNWAGYDSILSLIPLLRERNMDLAILP